MSDSSTLDGLLAELDDLRAQVESLQQADGQSYVVLSTANVSNPPTTAELNALFSTNVSFGFMAIINDNGANTNFWLIVRARVGGWNYVALTATV